MKTGFIALALAALSFSGAALADDVAGAWKISGDVVGNAVDTTCTFAGAAGKLTATCLADGKPGPSAPVTVAGKDVSWDWATDQATLTFKGKLDTDKSMKGDIEVSGVTGSFTAAKQ
jgi:type 1 fimbria pilin